MRRSDGSGYNPCVAGIPNIFLEKYRTSVLQVIQGLDLEKIGRVIDVLAEARDQGRRIFVCGNGGSASFNTGVVAMSVVNAAGVSNLTSSSGVVNNAAAASNIAATATLTFTNH